MPHLTFLLFLVSAISASVSITSSVMIYLRYRKKVIIYYLMFLVVISLLLTSKLLLSYLTVANLNDHSLTLFVSLLLEKSAYILALFAAPLFSHALIGIELSKIKKRTLFSLAGLYSAVTICELILCKHNLAEQIRLFVGLPILFGSFIYYLVLGSLYLGKIGDKFLSIIFKLTFISALLVLPLSLIQYITKKAYLYGYVEIPISFLVVTVATTAFSFLYLNKPAFMKKGSLTEFFIKKYSLTEREVELVALLIKGLSNADLADKLCISPRTVESHIYKIFQKTDVKNRSMLINLVLSNQGS